MLKTNYFKKVEALIELRELLRSMTGVIESIGETIRLWQKCDKLDEYWDHCWNYESDEINSHIANLYADMDAVLLVADTLASPNWGYVFPSFNAAYFVDRKEKLSGKILRSPRPVKQKLTQLQRMAVSAGSKTIQAGNAQWESWIRRDARFPGSCVSDAIVRLRILKVDIEELWMFISQMPNLKAEPTAGSSFELI
jgi:hypothetical protein